MNATPIKPIHSESLQADAVSAGTSIELRLAGAAELGAKAGLDQFFADVLAASRGCDEVVVDIRALEFMNSSCFKSLLTWIVRVQDLPQEQRHKIRFISNPSLHWQKRSLHSLASMGGGLIEVEERSETP
jgi:hypothetical protein